MGPPFFMIDAKTYYADDFDLATLPPYPDLPRANGWFGWHLSKNRATPDAAVHGGLCHWQAQVDINADLHGNFQCNNGPLSKLIAGKPVETYQR